MHKIMKEIKRLLDIDNLKDTITIEEKNFIKDNLEKLFRPTTKMGELENQEDINESAYMADEDIIKLLIASGDKLFVESFFKNNAEKLSGKMPADTLIAFGDENYLRKVLFDKSFPFTDYQREILIERIGDAKLTELCIRENTPLNLEPYYRAKLIISISQGNVQKIEEYLFDETIPFNSEAIRSLILAPYDKEFAKKCLLFFHSKLEAEDKIEIANLIGEEEITRRIVKEETNFQSQIRMINKSENWNIKEEFLKRNISKLVYKDIDIMVSFANKQEIEEILKIAKEQNANGEIIAECIQRLKSPEYTKEWETECIKIKNVAQLSLEELHENEKIQYVWIEGTEDRKGSDYYTREEYIQIRQAVDDILEGIEPPKKGDFNSELNAFCEIFKKLAHIQYDEFAVSEEGKKDNKLQKTCRNLYGGLIQGKSICRGYAEILKNCLSCIGIEAKCIRGIKEKDTKEEETGHAWIQVKIGGIWFNCDLTNDTFLGLEKNGKYAYRALKSDRNFECNKIYHIDKSKDEEKCEIEIEMLMRKKQLGDYVKKVANFISISEIKKVFQNLNLKIRGFRNNLREEQGLGVQPKETSKAPNSLKKECFIEDEKE